MINAGIYDGDFLVVRRQQTATNGEIVVARIDDEATVKRFFKEDDRIRLQPENSTHEPIYAREVAIVVIGVAVTRKLHEAQTLLEIRSAVQCAQAFGVYARQFR